MLVPTKRSRVVIIEDNDADVYLIKLALDRAGVDCEVATFSDGAKAQEALLGYGEPPIPCPDLILLDLNLPKIGGDKLLEVFRKSEQCGATPIIVMTSSDSPRDREKVQELGGVFFRKPTNLNEFLEIGALVKQTLAVGYDPSN